MKRALLISPADNVAVLTTAAAVPGDTVSWNKNGISGSVNSVENIPVYHKIAIRAIAAGETVIKYGRPIGIAKTDIPCGAHVHCHNIHSPEKEVD